ncbi:WYL domain-containing protein [Panacagrimonas sp.]|uniref:WYL domain-containing protein n=1 Tax=Panacagrimonas sp. TaxID=2480088 RepID=UPI003B5220EC
MSPIANDPRLPWDQRQRLRFAEALLIWRGAVSVGDIRDTFDVSTGKAERDLARYRRLAPDNLVADRLTGLFHPSDTFVPCLLRGSAGEYLQVLAHRDTPQDLPLAMASSGDVAAEMLEAPGREFDVRVLARLNTAIRERRWLAIDYQSMTHPEPRRLKIAPHVLAHAGRWHARAWSATHESYRDFLLSRICGLPELLEPCTRSADGDWDWQHFVPIRIGAHPDLTPAQKRVVEQDYGMLHGQREARVRVALAPYYLRMLGIGRDDRRRSPQEQQIVLLNSDDLDALNRLS